MRPLILGRQRSRPCRPAGCTQARIEALGGQILYWNGVRVMGVLAVSRAVGDHCLRPYVIAQPEVRRWRWLLWLALRRCRGGGARCSNWSLLWPLWQTSRDGACSGAGPCWPCAPVREHLRKLRHDCVSLKAGCTHGSRAGTQEHRLARHPVTWLHFALGWPGRCQELSAAPTNCCVPR